VIDLRAERNLLGVEEGFERGVERTKTEWGKNKKCQSKGKYLIEKNHKKLWVSLKSSLQHFLGVVRCGGGQPKMGFWCFVGFFLSLFVFVDGNVGLGWASPSGKNSSASKKLR